MSVSECCRQLCISRDTYYRHRLDTVFTRFQTPGGRPKVCRHEVNEYMQFADAGKARAAVIAMRKRMGRLTS
jgi:hypothetical protein